MPTLLQEQELPSWSTQLKNGDDSLLRHVQHGANLVTVSSASSIALHDEHIVEALVTWSSKTSSTLLYLEMPTRPPAISPLTLAALRIVLSAEVSDLPVASFFCQTQLSNPLEPISSQCDPLVGVVYSLVNQIFSVLPPLEESNFPWTRDRFSRLDGSHSSWDEAIKLLSDTLALAPPMLLCVIDSLGAFTNSRSSQLHDLVKVLRQAMQCKDKIFKVLVTTSIRIFDILPELSSSEIRILEPA